MPAVSTRPRNEGSFLAMSKASLNFRLFTMSVNSSTKPAGMAEPPRRSRISRTQMATSHRDSGSRTIQKM